MTISRGKCGAGAPAREKLRSAVGFRTGSFERVRLQPVRNRTQKSRALAPEGGRSL
jgi:hypothetical protein